MDRYLERHIDGQIFIKNLYRWIDIYKNIYRWIDIQRDIQMGRYL